jgi:putative addiction module component (TIGR02574 family)
VAAEACFGVGNLFRCCITSAEHAASLASLAHSAALRSITTKVSGDCNSSHAADIPLANPTNHGYDDAGMWRVPMSTGYQQIVKQALALSPLERVALAESMLDSVGEEETETLAQEEWESMWKAEVQRRLQRVQQGTAKVYSWDAVEQRLNRKLEAANNSSHG